MRKKASKQSGYKLHQPRGVAITDGTHAYNHITWAGIRQPWTAVSALLSLISMI